MVSSMGGAGLIQSVERSQVTVRGQTVTVDGQKAVSGHIRCVLLRLSHVFAFST